MVATVGAAMMTHRPYPRRSARRTTRRRWPMWRLVVVGVVVVGVGGVVVGVAVAVAVAPTRW